MVTLVALLGNVKLNWASPFSFVVKLNLVSFSSNDSVGLPIFWCMNNFLIVTLISAWGSGELSSSFSHSETLTLSPAKTGVGSKSKVIFVGTNILS